MLENNNIYLDKKRIYVKIVLLVSKLKIPSTLQKKLGNQKITEKQYYLCNTNF